MCLPWGIKKSWPGTLSAILAVICPFSGGFCTCWARSRPLGLKQVLDLIFNLTGTETRVFEEIYDLKNQLTQPSEEETSQLFAEFYRGTEKLAEVVDGIKI